MDEAAVVSLESEFDEIILSQFEIVIFLSFLASPLLVFSRCDHSYSTSTVAQQQWEQMKATLRAFPEDLALENISVQALRRW